jgi:hypothetical protein
MTWLRFDNNSGEFDNSGDCGYGGLATFNIDRFWAQQVLFGISELVFQYRDEGNGALSDITYTKDQ